MRNLIISLGVFMTTVSGLLAQNKMLVNLKSGVTVEYPVSYIESVTWEIGAQSGEQPGDQQGDQHEYVDLGLPSGLKWATCNVGASTPEEYGDYYAWGEIETKDGYYKSNYLYRHIGIDADGLEVEIWDYLGGDISSTDYDVAHLKWGGLWRMPTESEFVELKDNCTWTSVKMNDIEGYKVTGTNGNWIFLPAAGWREYKYLLRNGSVGSYWSSTPYPYNPSSAYSLSFLSGDIGLACPDRYCGRVVRPVTE